MSARVETKVELVTVSEDRAHVVRRGRVELAAGTTRVRVDGVAPVLADKTLKVTVDDGVTVGEVKIERRRLHLDAERIGLTPQAGAAGEAAVLDAEIDRLAAKERGVGRRRSRLEVELTGVDALITQTLADLGADAAWGRLDADVARARLRDLEALEKERRAEFLRVAEEHREAGEELARAKARRASMSEPATKMTASCDIALTTDAPRAVTLQLEYVVPGACWRPQHTARLDGARLSFATDACVWQNTGEAWENAEIVLSTERPSLGREPPLLVDDVLAAQKKAETLAVEAREEDVHTAGLGGAHVAAHAVPGIDDGGNARVMRARARATVATDGRPHRVPLASFETDAATELVMMPALALFAIKKTTQTNAGAAPILAGPVDLLGTSGVVGRTQVLFVAPGERFELGWGPDAGVRARRAVEEVDEDPSMLSNWLARSTRVTLHLSALDGASRALTVTEAVPVSEIDKVQISVDPKETTDGARADDDGFVKWTVKLSAHGRAQLKLRYLVKRHKDVTGM